MTNTQAIESIYVSKDYISGQFDMHLKYIDKRFDHVDKRIDLCDQKIDSLKEALEFSFNHLNEKIEDNTKDIKEIKIHMQVFNKKLDAFDQKFTPLLGLLTLIQK